MCVARYVLVVGILISALEMMQTIFFRSAVILFLYISIAACDSGSGLGAPYDELHAINCKILTTDALHKMPPDDFVRMAERGKEIFDKLMIEIDKEMYENNNGIKADELMGRMKTAEDISTCN